VSLQGGSGLGGKITPGAGVRPDRCIPRVVSGVGFAALGGIDNAQHLKDVTAWSSGWARGAEDDGVAVGIGQNRSSARVGYHSGYEVMKLFKV
jgi:hypothetical protein